jgi:hypothetical protein
MSTCRLDRRPAQSTRRTCPSVPIKDIAASVLLNVATEQNNRLRGFVISHPRPAGRWTRRGKPLRPLLRSPVPYPGVIHHDAIARGIARTAEQNYGLSGVVLSESR